MKRLDNGVAERKRNVADSHAVQMRVGMRLLVSLDLLGNVVKEIGILQVCVVFIGGKHFGRPSFIRILLSTV